MKHVFIVNPSAGRADAGIALVPRLIEQLAKMELDYVIEMTERPGHATDLARRYAMTREPVRFYACGGDGTLNEVVAGAAGYDNAAVTVFSGGSGNDFVKIFDDPKAFFDLHRLMDADEATFDLIRCNDDLSLNICSVGFRVSGLMRPLPW